MAQIKLANVKNGDLNVFDMIVNLYDETALEEKQRGTESEIEIVRVHSVLATKVENFVAENFNEYWASEAKCAIYKNPADCFIAIHKNVIVGFACYNTSAKGFFGPTGVHSDYRGKGIGKSLLFQSLNSMREQGFAYAIIGGVGSAEKFYEKTVNAKKIISSENHNIFRNLGIKRE
ncbi:GNAT family N-acetyltransferase [Desemzia sp. RIT804]|uniref:GNAT family N-acetyltransferase n=1 Tax=Desemzia sp. RIT 804 TaxID=2810209 RepID=UPI00194EB5BB|nr:GNAT family N-acetyltransferase [Desemzia sp. RIT 804]MBM6614924.1 GNAT family N-acetyltransferase [Desemzia sp. RIT 804]